MSSYLSSKIGDKDIEMDSIRSGFGEGLLKAAQEDESIFAVCADLKDSTKMNLFADEFPDRFVEVGAAEQNLVTVGSGLAAMGLRPFVSSYAAFSPGRNWEQIRTTICLNDQPVTIVGSHCGLSVGPDGATHQMLEDIALMRVLPNMIVVAPADKIEAEKATLALAKKNHPSYLRLFRASSPVFTTARTPFSLTSAQIFKAGTDCTVVSTGSMTYQVLAAAKKLAEESIHIEVIHVPVIKPLDSRTIIDSVKKTEQLITVEEAQKAAGFGSCVVEAVSEELAVISHRIGVEDRFGESGEPEQLIDEFGLSSKKLMYTIKQKIKSKREA